MAQQLQVLVQRFKSTPLPGSPFVAARLRRALALFSRMVHNCRVTL